MKSRLLLRRKKPYEVVYGLVLPRVVLGPKQHTTFRILRRVLVMDYSASSDVIQHVRSDAGNDNYKPDVIG